MINIIIIESRELKLTVVVRHGPKLIMTFFQIILPEIFHVMAVILDWTFITNISVVTNLRNPELCMQILDVD